MIRLSLRRPVAVSMTYATVALLGLLAWRNIPLEFLPDTSFPRLTVQAGWIGASPETVEAFLTAPLEAVVQRLPGVEKVTSTSTEGQASIEVEFNRDTDMDFARLDLSERLTALEEALPEGISRPTVSAYVPDELQDRDSRFLSYTFWGPYTLEALRKHIDDVIAPELRRVEGVAAVYAYGGRQRTLEISLNPDAIAALDLSLGTVRSAIVNLDQVREAGAVREAGDQRTITIVNRPQNAADIGKSVVAVVNGTIVRVSDVADIYDGFEERRSHSRINLQASTRFDVYREARVNAVRVADRVKERMADLEELNPYGSRLELTSDESDQIDSQMSELRTRALLGALVIFAVLFFFLRSLRSTALIFATVAFSVLIALNLIYFGGISLNVLTLMGLAMGFGLIVDNSIVVLENIYRRWQGGEASGEAAHGGAKEVVLPIMASTLTTLIVFVPFVYLQGELRIMYLPLAIVVGLTLVASIFVAFTFIPSLAARTLRLRQSLGIARRGVRTPFYMKFYGDLVSLAVRRPWWAIGFTATVFACSYYVFDEYVNKGPSFSWGRGGADTYLIVSVELPRGSNLERTDMLVRYFEDRLNAMPEVEEFTTNVGETRGRIVVTFPKEIEQTQIPVAIKNELTGLSHTFTGAEVRVQGFGPSFYGGGSSTPQYHIKVTGYNYEKVRDIAEALGVRLLRHTRVVDVDTNASAGYYTRDKASEFAVWVDRDRVAQLGFTVQEIVYQLRATIAGAEAMDSRIKLGGEEVMYSIKMDGNRTMDVVQLREALLETPDGRRVRAGDVVRIEQRDIMSNIRRVDQQYERQVSYEFRGPPKLGQSYQDAIIASSEVPVGYSIEESSRYGWFTRDQQEQTWLVIGIALLLIFMVTAALFESMLQPLCVMLTVPMALIGVYLIFFFLEENFTREAYFGVIMMFGIVVNNAILLVDHVNRVRLRESGLALREAILKGTLERVRPILMTTATTVLGLVPLVIFGQPGASNIWDALALVLIGGLLSSTLFVLTITPAIYGLIEGRHVRRTSDVAVPGGITAVPVRAVPR